jgi:hypothetical protein
MRISEVLINARKLIERPEHWCQGATARGKDGLSAGLWAGAYSYCMQGAIQKATPGEMHILPAYDYLCRTLPVRYRTRGLPAFNDVKTRTHAQVLKVFNRAIKAAQKDELGNGN